jgi:hypothetical protein
MFSPQDNLKWTILTAVLGVFLLFIILIKPAFAGSELSPPFTADQTLGELASQCWLDDSVGEFGTLRCESGLWLYNLIPADIVDPQSYLGVVLRNATTGTPCSNNLMTGKWIPAPETPTWCGGGALDTCGVPPFSAPLDSGCEGSSIKFGIEVHYGYTYDERFLDYYFVDYSSWPTLSLTGVSATLIEPEAEIYTIPTPPLLITSNLDTDIIEPIFTIKILDHNDNELYLNQRSSNGKINGYWSYVSVVPGLPDGTYKISGRVFSIDQGILSNWTTEITFIVSAGAGGGGGSSWGDELEEPTYTDPDFGLVGNWFRDVLKYLFMPSTDQMANITILSNKLKAIVPIRYFYDLKEAWDSASKVAAEPPTFSLMTNFGYIKIFDGAGIVNLFGASNWELIKDFSRKFIYLAGLVYLFFRFLRPMFKL